MFKFNIFLCIIIQIVINYLLIFCSADVNNVRDVNIIDSLNDNNFDERIYEDDQEEIENLVDPHSLYYDRTYKKVIKDVKVTRPELDMLIPSSEVSVLKNNGNNCNMLKVYYKRLILMLLTNANLKVENDVLNGQLFIKATSEQIETLKKLEIEDSSIKDIDSILSQIILKSSYYNYFFDMSNSFDVFKSLAKFVNDNVELIIFISCVLFMVILLRKMSLFHAVFVIFLALFAISYYMTWSKLLKEAEIKLAVSQVRHIEMPPECQPHNMHLWDRIKSYFSDADECKIYFESRMSDAKLQVTPLLTLSHLVTTVAMHPFGQFGKAISDFINNSTAHLNWLKSPVQILMYLFIPFFLMIIVFYLRGGSFSISLLPLPRFSFSTERPTSTSDTRRTIELIREVFAEIPLNNIPSIAATNKPVQLSINDKTKEQDEDTVPADDSVEKKFIESISNDSQKKLDPASGDFVQQKLVPDENKKPGSTVTLEEHSGGGDA